MQSGEHLFPLPIAEANGAFHDLTEDAATRLCGLFLKGSTVLSGIAFYFLELFFQTQD
jgi:hypothetical protein